MPEYITPTRAAEIIGCSTAYVRRLRLDGWLRSKKLGGGAVNFILRSDAERYAQFKKKRALARKSR